jgi:hypothetical protein
MIWIKGKPIIETLANMWYYELIRFCGTKLFLMHIRSFREGQYAKEDT